MLLLVIMDWLAGMVFLVLVGKRGGGFALFLAQAFFLSFFLSFFFFFPRSFCHFDNWDSGARSIKSLSPFDIRHSITGGIPY